MRTRRACALAAGALAPLILSACGASSVHDTRTEAHARWRAVESAVAERDRLIPELSAELADPALAKEADLAGVEKLAAYVHGLSVGADATSDPARFARYVEAQAELSRALDRAVLVAERKPGLAADAKFAATARRLDESEARIAIAGVRYDRAAGAYNGLVGGPGWLSQVQTLWSGATPLPLIESGLATAAMGAAGAGPSVGGGVSLRISGSVPLICSVSVTKPPIDPADAAPDKDPSGKLKKYSLGQLEEVCNSGGGFDTYATTSPVQPGAVFVVDGQRIPVSAGGATLVDTSDTAEVKKRALAYETADGAPTTMSVTIRAR
jgi:LemA protein